MTASEPAQPDPAAAASAAQGAAAHGGLGISYVATPFGAMLMAVAPGSIADRAGLKAGETIETANGIPLKGFALPQLQAALGAASVTTVGVVGVGEVRLR